MSDRLHEIIGEIGILHTQLLESGKIAVFQIMFPAVSQLCFHFCKQVSRV